MRVKNLSRLSAQKPLRGQWLRSRQGLPLAAATQLDACLQQNDCETDSNRLSPEETPIGNLTVRADCSIDGEGAGGAGGGGTGGGGSLECEYMTYEISYDGGYTWEPYAIPSLCAPKVRRSPMPSNDNRSNRER